MFIPVVDALFNLADERLEHPQRVCRCQRWLAIVWTRRKELCIKIFLDIVLPQQLGAKIIGQRLSLQALPAEALHSRCGRRRPIRHG